MNTSHLADRVGVVLSQLVAEGQISPAQASLVSARLSMALPEWTAEPPEWTAEPPEWTPTHQSPGVSGAGESTPPQGGLGGRLAEIAGYVGGALVFGAAALFIGSTWASLDEGTRFLFLAVVTVLLAGIGIALASAAGGPVALRQQPDSARRRLVATVWVFAAVTAAGTAAVLASDEHALVAAATVGLALSTTAYVVLPTAVGQIGAWAWAVTFATSGLDELGESAGTDAYAVLLVLLGASWAAATLTGLLREQQTGLVLASGTALVGAQLPVIDGSGALGYLLTAVVAAAGFSGYLATRSWAVLAAGVVATTLVVPEAVYDWTDGSVSSAGVLLVAGLTLLGASAAGLRLRKLD